jgi:hypothetical protein
MPLSGAVHSITIGHCFASASLPLYPDSGHLSERFECPLSANGNGHRHEMHVGSVQNRWQIGAGRLVMETDGHECPLVDELQAAI